MPASLGRIRVNDYRDFSGGINRIADQYQLALNESPDMDSVDLQERGGWKLRKGVNIWGGAGTATLVFGNATMVCDTLFRAEGLGAAPGGATKYVFAVTKDGSNFVVSYATSSASGWTLLSYSGSGTPWPTVQAYMGTAQMARASQRIHKVYMCNFTDASRCWDGTTLTVLTDVSTTYNEVIASPAGGEFPKCKYIAVYQGRMVAAYTSESSVTYPNRVRFSHPAEPEDWRANDYLDVDFGGDGDVITGLEVRGDRLFVFKNHSIYQITGTTADNIQVFQYDRHIGAVGPKAICNTDVGIFFFDARSGLHLIEDPNKPPRYMFEKLRPSLLDASWVNANFGNGRSVNLAWNGRKLYLGLPRTLAISDELWVLDTAIGGKSEAWTRYKDIAFDAILTWRVEAASPVTVLMGTDLFDGSKRRFVQLDAQEGQDTWVTGVPHAIPSYFVTAWFDISAPTVVKRFKRPVYLVRDQETSTITVDVYQDWDGSDLATQHTYLTAAPGTVLKWYAGGASTLDVGVWGGAGATRETPKKGANLGAAYSVQLKFNGPPEKVPWAVDEVSFRYIMKKVR